MSEQFQQRHFNQRTGLWSDWYPSSKESYREHLAGPVSFYEVRSVLDQGPFNSEKFLGSAWGQLRNAAVQP